MEPIVVIESLSTSETKSDITFPETQIMDASTSLALPCKREQACVSETRFATTLSATITPTPGVSISSATPVLSRASLLLRRNSTSLHIHDEVIASKVAAKQELASIGAELDAYMCTKRCMCNISSLSPQDVQSQRHSTRYYVQGPNSGKSKTPADHKFWLTSCIMQSRKRKIGQDNNVSMVHASRHTVLGLSVCATCFVTLFGISKSKYDRCVHALKNQINSHGSGTVLTEQLVTLEESARFEMSGLSGFWSSPDLIECAVRSAVFTIVNGAACVHPNTHTVCSNLGRTSKGVATAVRKAKASTLGTVCRTRHEVEQAIELGPHNIVTIVGDLNNWEEFKRVVAKFNKVHVTGNLSFALKGIQSLPENIGNITVGGDLDLKFNKLPSLPEGFGDITVVGSLLLHNNNLTSLPEDFGKHVGGTIILSCNNLTSLPESFPRKFKLHLNLSYNQLGALPDWFGNITVAGVLSLQSLNRDGKTSLPRIFHPWVGMDLHLNHNQFESLLGGFCPSVRGDLVLESNGLTSLPESISDAKVGGDVYFAGNYVEIFPEGFGRNVGGTVIFKEEDRSHKRRRKKDISFLGCSCFKNDTLL